MDIVISNTSGDPIYQQIFEQISAQIINGLLTSDTCLPPIRTVAKELRISVITVKRAWEELGISKATFYRRLREIQED